MSYKLVVRPRSIVAIRQSNKRFKEDNHRVAPIRSSQRGVLSHNARSKFKHAIRWLIACSDTKQCYEKQQKKMVDYRIGLTTLTFKENMQDDNKARALLGMWLEMAKYRFGLERYVWKAEPQKRGAIHFHIACGKYLPHAEVCYTWNRLLFKNGYDQRNANSTDVHAVIGVNSLEAYLTEYLMNEDKHAGRRLINGRLWGCDHKLSQAGKKYLYIDNDDALALSYSLAEFNLRHKLEQPKKFLEFVDVYCLPPSFWNDQSSSELLDLYKAELELLKPTIRTPELFGDVKLGV